MPVMKNGNTEEGITMKPSSTNTIPLEAQYLYQRGLEMISQQQEDIALVYFKQAVFIAPGFSKAYRELGKCLTRLGRTEEASVYYMKASRIDPYIHDARVADGVPLKRQDTDRALFGLSLTHLIW
jgi:tetratricopeptide (TPR) repeat protein